MWWWPAAMAPCDPRRRRWSPAPSRWGSCRSARGTTSRAAAGSRRTHRQRWLWWAPARRARWTSAWRGTGGGRCGCRGRSPQRRHRLLRGRRRGAGCRGLRGSEARRAAWNVERAAPRLAGAASPAHPDAAAGRRPATANGGPGRDRLQWPVPRVGLRRGPGRGSGRRAAGPGRLLRHEPRRRDPALPGGRSRPATTRTADALSHRSSDPGRQHGVRCRSTPMASRWARRPSRSRCAPVPCGSSCSRPGDRRHG